MFDLLQTMRLAAVVGRQGFHNDMFRKSAGCFTVDQATGDIKIQYDPSGKYSKLVQSDLTKPVTYIVLIGPDSDYQKAKRVYTASEFDEIFRYYASSIKQAIAIPKTKNEEMYVHPPVGSEHWSDFRDIFKLRHDFVRGLGGKELYLPPFEPFI